MPSEDHAENEANEAGEASAAEGAAQSAESDEPAYTPDEEAKITKRLEDLGYL